MQVLYLLDIDTHELRHITTSYEDMDMHSIQITAKSRCIVVFWEEYADGGFQCDVHARAGHRVASFRPQAVSALDPPAKAFMLEDRMALAGCSNLDVWDLASGQLIGSRTPTQTVLSLGSWALSKVSVNLPGTKVAFLPAGCSTLYLYDSRTLAALTTVLLSSHALPPGAGSLVWGAYSWMLTSCSQLEADINTERAQCTQAFQPTAGSSCPCTEVLRLDALHHHVSAASPDGCFLLYCELATARLVVHDLRSGRVLLTQDLEFPEGVPEHDSSNRHMAVSWSSCGCRLLIMTRMPGDARSLGLLTVIQLQS